ncbi:hypothetical protein predicted by Glimmer/Critica [Sorangium cellulosum So ce56]|uniref:Uncharacterized protein n=1 Tax=Sorangium cellulosum (strain So ce56) TaxID=448385 RepID=A9FPB2_SORC5|nr:hypothetical protein predicted by Glimmer/Critica [Sorangium cellulosum So ce56]
MSGCRAGLRGGTCLRCRYDDSAPTASFCSTCFSPAPRSWRCRARSAGSQLHLSTRRTVANGRGEVALQAHLLEDVPLPERTVRVAEARSIRAQPIELLPGQDDRHEATSPGELDDFTSFRLLDDGGEMGPSFCDGVATRHSRDVHSYNRAVQPSD